jgi:hypothetical protein
VTLGAALSETLATFSACETRQYTVEGEGRRAERRAEWKWENSRPVMLIECGGFLS